MIDAILSTLYIMGWLGLVFGILVVVNTVTGSLVNVWTSKEVFSFNKLFKGISKSLVFFISAVAIGVAFTILPFINEMITYAFGVMLISNETLNTLSSVGVLGVVISTIIVQGKKAIEGIIKLANLSANTEEITWKVEEE